ncbi:MULTISPECIES: divalent-cation tolerance protein CutA [unclassified Thioalkalivibrio]|uniref:divalent-cation tolerance protein CutA n=1 Tax=unclassified Thioalkalivibrio TaxID=2621013 RepID=UPI00037306DE|nr:MULTISPECIES: divalent-cation tolerance protein CutA [unclassified Thioalkalivibrio]PYG03224.1 divalent cation tolerance protein [Thioalkalivibrio sp. ALE21]
MSESDPAPAWLVITTLDDADAAERLAGHLVEAGRAACVHMLPPGRSIYQWQGRIEVDSEVTLLIKTSREAWPELRATLHDQHPYDTPEIIALPIEDGLPDYLNWIHECTR